jgi:predicted regulator of Ras-like GTPase activity (Roadblock/LC7/MglB family)
MTREISAWQRELKRNPGAPAFARLAERLREHDELGEAMWVCSRGLLANPNYSTGHVILAEILWENGLKKRARDEFTEALNLDGNNARARLGLAHLLLQEGDWQQALQQLDFLLFWQPTHHTASKLREQAASQMRTQQVSGLLQEPEAVPAAAAVEPVATASPAPPGLVPGREKELGALIAECEAVGGAMIVNQEGLVAAAVSDFEHLEDGVAAKLVSICESSNRYLMRLGLGYLEGILIEGEGLILRIFRYENYLVAATFQNGAKLGVAEAELTKAIKQLDRRRHSRASDGLPRSLVWEGKDA